MTDTVVLCGSLGSTSAMWDAQIAPLAERYGIVTVEHPGHGGAAVEDLRSVAGLAQRVLSEVPADRFSFLGLSLGGAIGIRIALDAPERLDRLVLACTSARFGPAASWQERAATVRDQGMEAVADVVLERWFTPGFPGVQRYREMFVSTDPEGYARCCEAIADWDAREALRAVQAPTLAIAGEDDPSTPPEHLELIAGAIPGARLEVIPRARHLANVEFADDFNTKLLSFL